MTEISPRTPCSNRSASERVPLIGTKATADFHQGAQPPGCNPDAVYMAATEITPAQPKRPCPAGAIHTRFEGMPERAGTAGGDDLMTLALVAGAIGGDAAVLLIGRESGRAVLAASAHHLHRSRRTRRRGFPRTSHQFRCGSCAKRAAWSHHACGRPLPFALDLYARAVDKKVERALKSAIEDVDLQCLMAAAEGAEVRHRPVQSDQPQQALDMAGRLPERHAEQNLNRQAGLDRSIAVVGQPTTLAGGLSAPVHLGIEPNCQRAPALERFVIGRPVPDPVGGGVGLRMPPSYHAGFAR